MNSETHDHLDAMNIAGARAIGVLTALISLDLIPKLHRAQAGEIVAQFDQASAAISAICAANEAAAKEAAPLETNFCYEHGHAFTAVGVCAYCSADSLKAKEAEWTEASDNGYQQP